MAGSHAPAWERDITKETIADESIYYYTDRGTAVCDRQRGHDALF